MKIIGAGLPRTATLTQKIALEMLGFGPCYHMINVLTDASLIPGWTAAFDGHPDWDTLLAGFESAVDWPGSFYYRELAEAYPDAKVLLSVRDGRAWARSMHDTIWGFLYGDSLAHYITRARAKVDPGLRQYNELMEGMWTRSGLFGPDPRNFDEDVFAAGMERHNAEVRQHIPAERLLEWWPKDGWEPLCAFLDVPVPDVPLPHVNDSGALNDMIIGAALKALNEWHAQRTAG